MVRCKHCGAENYAIDMWCSNCSQHLDWAPAAATAAAPTNPEPLPDAVPSPDVQPVASAPEPKPVALPVAAATTAAAAAHVETAAPAAAAAAAAAAPVETAAAAAPVETAAPVAPAAAPVETAAPAAAAAAPVKTTAPAAGAPVETASPARSRRKAPVWILPLAAAAVVAVLLAMPVLGWFKAAGQQSTAQLPLTALNSNTPTASPQATPSPSLSATPEATQAPTDQAAAQPAPQPAQAPPAAQQPAPVPAVQPASVGDPTSSVASFYQAVAAHQFDAAAATWSARMQSAFPPPEYINHRFAYTQRMDLRQAQIVSNNGQSATVYIDLIEVYAGSTRHWVGTWQLVATSSGWLLNQPNLRAAG